MTNGRFGPLDRKFISGSAFVLVILAILAGGGASTAESAASTGFIVAPRTLSEVDSDTLLLIIPPRPEDQIRADKETADQLRSQEDIALQQSAGREAVARSRLEVAKKEVEALKARAKLAEEQGDTSGKERFEAQRLAAESHLDLLEKTAGMRTAEKDLSETAKGAAAALVRYYDTELDLAILRAAGAPKEANPQDPAVMERLLRYERDLLELERRGMEALLLQIEKREELLKKEQRLLDRRVELFEAQNAVRAGRTR